MLDGVGGDPRGKRKSRPPSRCARRGRLVVLLSLWPPFPHGRGPAVLERAARPGMSERRRDAGPGPEREDSGVGSVHRGPRERTRV